MGVSPEIWGPSTWAFLHLMPFAEEEPLRPERLGYYKELYQLLTNLLPCQNCRNHLRENLSKLPEITKCSDKKELFLWTARLHNCVNQQHKKPEMNLEEAYAFWKNVAEGKTNLRGVPCTPSYWKYGAILLVFVAIIYLVYLGLRRWRYRPLRR